MTTPPVHCLEDGRPGRYLSSMLVHGAADFYRSSHHWRFFDMQCVPHGSMFCHGAWIEWLSPDYVDCRRVDVGEPFEQVEIGLDDGQWGAKLV